MEDPKIVMQSIAERSSNSLTTFYDQSDSESHMMPCNKDSVETRNEEYS